MKLDELTLRLRDLLHDDKIVKLELIQGLWSGFGEVSRFVWPKQNRNIVVKQFLPPSEVHHPRGWNSEVSTQRKIDSYINEQYFYQDFANQCDLDCKVPKPLLVEVNNTDQLIVLEDLVASGFNVTRELASDQVVKLGIRWLAYFHGKFLNTAATNLWSVGTYWHLGTRLDEWRAMPSSQLKDAASIIDQTLNQCQYQTLVHGDAKLANFCFTDTSDDLAAVDFQYVGRGTGMKDLAYYLGCCFSGETLLEREDEWLNYYFDNLRGAFTKYSITAPFEEVEAQWRALYPFANADFQRFLSGWSPGHQKLNRYLDKQTNIALQRV